MESKAKVIRGNEEQNEDIFPNNKEGNKELIGALDNSNEIENGEKTSDTSGLNPNVTNYYRIPDDDNSIEQSKTQNYYNIDKEESHSFKNENSKNFVKFKTLKIPILFLGSKDDGKSKTGFYKDIFNNNDFCTQPPLPYENFENENLFENEKKIPHLKESDNNVYKTNFRFLNNYHYGIKFPKMEKFK